MINYDREMIARDRKSVIPTARVLGTLIFTIIMAWLIFGSAPRARAAQTQPLVEGNTVFAFDLYAQLKSNQGNLFFSPYSISTALAMTYAGARGETEQQMGRVLHFVDSQQQQFHSAFGELQRQLSEASKEQGIELNIANALWAQKDHSFLPAFVERAKDVYQANVNQADFKSGAEAARAEINRWVAQETKDKIQHILPPGSLTDLTRLVLANAIYFKGKWAEPFKVTETSNQTFHVSNTRRTDVPLMHHFDEVRYMESNDFQALELPYSDGALSMVILLPRQVDGCGRLEDQLTSTLFSRALGQMKQQRVEIFLPRFKLESGFNLNDTLAKMGITDAFGRKADFSGIDGTQDLYISGVFHKAWGEVNEQGTEAAAATTVAISARVVMKAPPPPPVFRADHPFIFFIRDTRSGSILFLGRFEEPSR
jgi:serpin B